MTLCFIFLQLVEKNNHESYVTRGGKIEFDRGGKKKKCAPLLLAKKTLGTSAELQGRRRRDGPRRETVGTGRINKGPPWDGGGGGGMKHCFSRILFPE